MIQECIYEVRILYTNGEEEIFNDIIGYNITEGNIELKNKKESIFMSNTASKIQLTIKSIEV